jgi:hypothetical protein
MRKISLPLPELLAIAGTRVALGVGIGLPVGDYLVRSQRQTLGWTLLALGLLSTVPLESDVWRRLEHRSPQRGNSWKRLVAASGGEVA